MFGFASTRSHIRHIAGELYGSSVAASRSAEFYRGFGVPDTAEGRFEMLVVHLYLLQERLRQAGTAGEELGRAVAEQFVSEMDNALREMGVGDMGIPRRVKQAAEAYNGRLLAYAKAMAQKDEAELEAALQRNVHAGMAPEGGVARLAHYLRAARAALDAQDTEAILSGAITFPNPSAGGLS